MTRHQDIAELDEVYILGRLEAQRIDHEATERFGIPSIVLMENAALHLAEVAASILDETDQTGVLICVGPGSNGGDGLAMARHMHNDGADVRVLLVGEAGASGNAATHLAIARAMGLDVRSLDQTDPAAALQDACERPANVGLIIDAIFGIGLNRPLQEPYLATIGAVNDLHDRGIQVMAVDTPTGLDAETGELLGSEAHPAIAADLTVTFSAVKRGFLSLEAQSFVGEVIVADIGAPIELIHQHAVLLDDPERPGDASDPKQPKKGQISRHAGEHR